MSLIYMYLQLSTLTLTRTFCLIVSSHWSLGRASVKCQTTIPCSDCPVSAVQNWPHGLCSIPSGSRGRRPVTDRGPCSDPWGLPGLEQHRRQLVCFPLLQARTSSGATSSLCLTSPCGILTSTLLLVTYAHF